MFKSELNDNDKIQLIGQILLKREFKDWFLFFFKLVEGKNFDIEPIIKIYLICLLKQKRMKYLDK